LKLKRTLGVHIFTNSIIKVKESKMKINKWLKIYRASKLKIKLLKTILENLKKN